MLDRWDYEGIKRTARARRKAGHDCVVGDLFALSRNNDPFYMGTPGELEQAAWFADLWERFGYTDGVHLRRVHYNLISQDPVPERPCGTPYTNTKEDWAYLLKASKVARYLGYVAPELFVDRRNPSAIVNARWSNPGDSGFRDPSPRYEVDGSEWDVRLPLLPVLRDLSWKLPSFSGFDLEGYYVQQEVLLEVWVEKTSVNDVLEPLCRRYDVNLVTGTGELSITAALELVQRVERSERPARVFYISDFDPQGYGMPVSVARKIEFFLRDRGLDFDMRLEPIALTKEQVVDLELPPAPIGKKERREARFEDVHGERSVKLDALEALYPGRLEEIVESAILTYYDPDLKNKALDRELEARDILDDERRRVLEGFDGEVESVRRDYAELLEEFGETQEGFNELVADFEAEIEAHREKLDAIKESWEELEGKVNERLEAANLDLPDTPGAELPPEPDGTLYDSSRDYLDQLSCYKARQEGGT